MIIHPIDNLLTVARCADAVSRHPQGAIPMVQMRLALKNLEAIPGHGSGPQRAADALQDLATQLNRVAAAIGYPGPQWDAVAFPNLASALLGYAARVQQQAIDAACFQVLLDPSVTSMVVVEGEDIGFSPYEPEEIREHLYESVLDHLHDDSELVQLTDAQLQAIREKLGK